MRLRVSVVVATLDEELHIERVIHSCRGLGPVYVVDAGSTDQTRQLAEAAGAHVVEHEWVGYAEQKNWALDNLPIETGWVLFLDADEYVTDALRDEIVAVAGATPTNGFWIPRINVFLGRPLRHVWWYPDYQLRLFLVRRGRYEDRLVHEHVVLDGEAGFLKKPIMHENLKGIDEFLRRHERYARLEAEEIMKVRRGELNGRRRGSFRGTWPERRRALKTRVWYRLPARPATRFFWMYIVKRGFLDGRQGRVYAQLVAAYEAMIDAYLAERELQE